jgi:Ser/Thr protein kinase RdoA (MazF antagonist)
MFDSVLKEFGLDKDAVSVVPIHQGLINATWRVAHNGDAYILQKVNDQVFNNPEDIAFNISLIAEYLGMENPRYFFVSPVKTTEGLSMTYKKEYGYYRVFPFVKNSHTKDTLDTVDQAFEAAMQFGRFTKVLNGLDISKLRITIPSFHDLTMRYARFLEALKNGNPERVAQSAYLTKQLQQLSWIAQEYEQIKKNPEFKLRVTHHDTKISNVLFDNNNKSICVIDLDTVMPGYFISDVGDMMRTYLSPSSEEEKDFRKIEIRDEFYKAIVKGYYNEMKEELSLTEKIYFFYAGEFMIYMQALRFLTDYLNDDFYYGEKYPGHNLIRAENQLILLQRLIEKEHQLAGLYR